MRPIRIKRHDITFRPDNARVIIRPFIPGPSHQITDIIGRALALPEADLSARLKEVKSDFDARHFDIDSILTANYEKVRRYVPNHHPLSREKQLLIGALFSGEYALESAALFNPSIVPHPDQSDIPPGSLRFIMSLRATGEGHISSIEFRGGILSPDGGISLDPVSRFVTEPEIAPNPSYRKDSFIIKLHEMGLGGKHCSDVMESLGDHFTRSDLDIRVDTIRDRSKGGSYDLNRTLECVQWLADSNYEVQFSENLTLSERIIFPVSANESNGIEDARFVRFTNGDGSAMFYATYTAYNGHSVLPQLLETRDFLHFRILTLNGDAVQNKGMALFPRRINGNYAMLSRQDGENLFLMFSNNPHYWSNPRMLLGPAETWEAVKIGNCGSPIETEAGWLVITHGVGPMRRYCIGAALLDLENPAKVIGRLRDPLLFPEGLEREGYVPNVVYSCGSMIHNDQLVLPFAVSDHASAVVSVNLDDLLSALISG